MEIISLFQWTSTSDKYQLYTYTDGENRYPITNNGSVFFYSDINHVIKDILKNNKIYIPFSDSNSKEIFEINKIISIYDEKFNIIIEDIGNIDYIYSLCEYYSLYRRQFENFTF
jgi:general stress protein 26